ncbi:MAG TPA: hypothetical protein VLL52_09780 [Anaerolineae bacterium]|nr:hypothetical protein [Anaerolineae bacterium]
MKLIEVDRSSTEAIQPKLEAIRQICERYDDLEYVYLDDVIDDKREATVRKHFNIPADEALIFVYDDTILGSNKIGFALAEKGLYWNNDWATTTKRTFLSWADLAERTFAVNDLRLILGRGDKIGIAGGAGNEGGERLVAMFDEIKALLLG